MKKVQNKKPPMETKEFFSQILILLTLPIVFFLFVILLYIYGLLTNVI